MRLGQFIFGRLLQLIPLLIGLSLLTFVVSRIVPGDPVGLAAGPQATPEIKEKLRQEFGLDKPLPMQYLSYIGNIFRGDWGESLYSRRQVAKDLRTYFPATLELSLMAVIIASVIGVPLGIFSSLYKNKWPDHFTRVLALFFVSFPAFWLAMIFQLFFGLALGWFPIGKRFNVLTAPPESMTGLYLIDSLLQLDFTAFGTAINHITIPALVLSFGSLASIARITRASMLESLDADFIRTARASGIAFGKIVRKYVLRNALIPIVTAIGLEFGWLMAGAVLVESIFDWPGLGLYAVESSLRLDFQPIMGITIIYGVVFSLVNIITDVAYSFIDPRIRYG